MEIFDFTDYRHYLNSVCNDEAAPRGLRAALAREAGCQASYFSQVLKERSHLTEDQLLGVAHHLELSPAVAQHLLLLLRYTKAATVRLQTHLKAEIEKAKQSQFDLQTLIDAEAANRDHDGTLGVYFSTWIYSAVHLLTSNPNYQKPEPIAERLQLPITKIKECLLFLVNSGFVDHSGKNYVFKRGSFHVAKDSPLQAAVQSSRRELAARSIAINPLESMHFSSLFTIDEADLAKIKEIFTRSIEKSHKVIHGSGTRKLACLCVDLFEIV